MNTKTKIMIGVALLVLGAVVVYFMMSKKGTTTTTTSTSSGLHGLDLGGIIGALEGTGTKAPEVDPTKTTDQTQGARHTVDLANSIS